MGFGCGAVDLASTDRNRLWDPSTGPKALLRGAPAMVHDHTLPQSSFSAKTLPHKTSQHYGPNPLFWR